MNTVDLAVVIALAVVSCWTSIAIFPARIGTVVGAIGGIGVAAQVTYAIATGPSPFEMSIGYFSDLAWSPASLGAAFGLGLASTAHAFGTLVHALLLARRRRASR
jgi:hypothetical protein